MTRPSDIPQWIETKVGTLCHELPLITAGRFTEQSTKKLLRSALLSAYERGRGERQEDIAFIARWAWRTDPPGSSRAMTDTERLSVIKYYPPVQGAAKEHIELAEREAAEAKR